MQFYSAIVTIVGIAGIVTLEITNFFTIKTDGQLLVACLSAIVYLITKSHYKEKYDDKLASIIEKGVIR